MFRQILRSLLVLLPLPWYAWTEPAAAAPVGTPAGGYPANEDLRLVRSLSDARISPDGSQVLLSIADSTAAGGRSHLWLIDASKNQARQITFSPEADKIGEHQGRWLGNDAILFLAKRSGRTQLFRLPMNGGEARPYDLKVNPPVDASKAADALPPGKDEPPPAVGPVAIEVDDYEVAPDASRVAILARDPETSGEKKQKDAKADATWIDHDLHGNRLFLLDPASGSLTAVSVPPDVELVAWAHSSQRLIAVSEGPNHLGDLVGPNASVWMVDVGEPADPHQLQDLPRTFRSAQWSADDARLYFLAQSARDAPPGYLDLYALDLTDRRLQNLSGHSNLTGAIYGSPLVLSDQLWVGVQTGTRMSYARLQSGEFEVPSSDLPVLTSLDCDRQASACVWIGESSSIPRTLFLGARPGGQARRLNTPALLPGIWPAAPVQTVHWRNEGLDIEGLLYQPTHASAKQSLIVDVHGGPTGAWVQRFDAFIPFLLGQGFAVFRPNPRGSTGYGVSFVAANKNDLGGGDYRDIMSGTNAVVTRYPIDASRLILMGYSYGGEMAGFIEGRTDRFRAVISGAPVIDQQSEYGTEAESWYDRWFYGKPWEHFEAAWRQGPLAGVAHAKSPFLLIQGESDSTDPQGQSQEMYRALRQAGVHVELVQYPRENHVPLMQAMRGEPSQEPWHGYDARQRIMTFINDALTNRRH